MSAPGAVAASLRRGDQGRRALALLAALVLVALGVSLMVGHTYYGPDTVWRVVTGETVPGASFTVGELRLPRAALALLAGVAFGVGGVTFQTLLRNPLASPDIIGVSQGAAAAGVVAIVVLGLSGLAVSAAAVVGALATAATIYLLAWRDGVAGARLVLIGIGVAAMLHSVISWVLLRASQWDLQVAMRWLTGSLNHASWGAVGPLLVAVVVVVPVLLSQARALALLGLGDDTAAALGVATERTRVVAVVGAVLLVACATAAAGPIAFVAFLAGPIAARLVGPGRSLLVPAALVGALIVLASDQVGQWALETRYPVGVVTGALGAPYLLVLIARTTKAGGSL